MGNLRGGEKAWDTLYKNVLDPNSADLALIIGEDSYLPLYPNSTLLKRAKLMCTFPEYTDWADAVDQINGEGWRETHLSYFSGLKLRRNGLLGGIAGYIGSGAIIFMIRWFLSQCIIDHDLLNKYERFVITRADHYYQCNHTINELDLQNNTMWIPEGEEWGGYTDRHLIVGRKNLLDALDIFPSLLRESPDYFISQAGQINMNPEYILKQVWMYKNLTVKTFPRVMFTAAISGDTTRWKTPEGEVPGVPGLFLKYPNEYHLTQNNCRPLV